MRASAPVAAGPLGNEQLTTLTRRLIAATAAGSAEWHGREPDCYRWASGDGSVRVSSRDRDGQPPYELAVFNTRDEKVDDLSSELVGDEPAAWNRSLAELYRAARRNALNADEIVEALLGSLRTGDRPDAEPEETRTSDP